MSGFESVIEKIRAESTSTSELGTRFERLIKNYLATHPTYNFAEVRLWNDFPYRDQFGGHDIGIDIVARTHLGEYWAVQCKCFSPDTRIDKPALDSFLAASGKAFIVDGNETRFVQRLWISTAYIWTSNASAEIKRQTPPVIRLGPPDLDHDDVDWFKLAEVPDNETRVKNSLRSYQTEAVDAAVEHFRDHERGKLIMACGTGKTFTSLKIAESLIAPRGTVLYLTPSISLINQTLFEWTAQSDTPINAICVCSDQKVSKRVEDENIESVDDLKFPVTTEPTEINNKIRADAFNVIFSTYQSLDAVAAAQSLSLRITNYELRIDLIIADEAHRTSGCYNSNWHQ